MIGYDVSTFGSSGEHIASDVPFDLVSLGFTVDGIQYELDARDVAETHRTEVFDRLFSLMITAGNDIINTTHVDPDGDSINDEGQIIRGLSGYDLILAGGGGMTGSCRALVTTACWGGRGTETAVFAGGWEGFSFSADAEERIVRDRNTTASGEGGNTLFGVERLAFADGVTGRVALTETRLQVTLSGAEAAALARRAFDNGNMARWATYDIRYAPDGSTRQQMTVTDDDGRVMDRDYDASGTRRAQTVTDTKDVCRWASYTRTYDAEGQVIATVFVDDPL